MISKITPQISIGNAEDARQAINSDFDSTLNLAIDLDIQDNLDEVVVRRLKRHKVGLVDGPGNPPLRMVAALLLLHTIVESGVTVLVHCQAGMSRSVMVVAAYLDMVGASSLDDALAKIMPLRKVDQYSVAMYNLAQSAIPVAKSVIEYGKNK
jgi:hypothetical protein